MGRTGRMRADWASVLRAAFALAVGSVGSMLFVELRLPLPWLLGALTACLIAAVVRLPLARPRPLVGPMRVVLGLAIGSTFTPALADRIGEMAISLVLLIPFVAVMGVLGFAFFERVVKLDRPTAFFAAMPGGFNDMLAMGRDAGANERQLSLVHATRVLIIVFTVPFWMQWTQGVEIGARPVALTHLGDLDAPTAALMLVCGAIGWWSARRLGISGAAIIGPMALTATLHVTGLLAFNVPVELINGAQLVLGAHAGCQFIGVTAREFVTTILGSIAYAIALLMLTALFSTLVLALTDADLISVVLAYSPGGQAEMNLIAVVLSGDAAYVALHHLARMAMVVLGAQFIFRYLSGRPVARIGRPEDD